MQRKQFNVAVNVNLINKIKKLTAEYSVSGYALVEHILQVGYFYVDKTEKNQKVREVVCRHLIDRHLLKSSHSDPEEIIRLGEGSYSSELLSRSRNIIRLDREFRRAFQHAKRTGDSNPFEKVKAQLFSSTFELTQWLSSHPLDELDEED